MRSFKPCSTAPLAPVATRRTGKKTKTETEIETETEIKTKTKKKKKTKTNILTFFVSQPVTAKERPGLSLETERLAGTSR